MNMSMARTFQLSLQLIGDAGFALALGSTLAVAQTTQQHIHEMGHTVMPFDLNKTTHIFRMTDFGGVQSVVVKDAQDRGQIGPIRQHLQHEAEAFQRGDYADPMSLHGTAMPIFKTLGFF
jgi:imidazoleglycerol phosphate dehydratase HisB